ncbi:hypothetical protein HPG69_012382 [Diceros bicornis minor]|uniref:Uncharacterized protein n=1 Tax=Diceros bicornis minor TaxID=77932 RepID=A0A7J7F5G3_DICBM|nr:hypothetical protein HPG69_012382 [Diceros bicornis minor]
MNTFLLSALCLLWAWAALAGGVTVQVSPLSLSRPASSLPPVHRACPLREHSLSGAGVGGDGELWLALTEPPLSCPETIAQDPSMCEICAYAACAGCWDRWCSLPSAPPLQDAPSSRSPTYLPPNQERAAWGGPAPDPIRAARCFPRATPTLT